jgi:1-acyl-sn-glycerol-3-phosphate acyltransferase
MSFGRSLAVGFVKGIFDGLCRVDDAQVERIPRQGPLILVTNHVNFLDVPVLYTHLFPRPLTTLIKSENWDHVITRNFFEFGGGIPIRRGEVDLRAFRLAKNALDNNRIIIIAPEGTRSGTGLLQKGRSGVVLLALRSGAPIQPIACYGGEEFRHNISHFRRTNLKIVAGAPFRLNAERASLDRGVREEITREIMLQIAALLPDAYRGVYAGLDHPSEEFLVFAPGVKSNLDPIET